MSSLILQEAQHVIDAEAKAVRQLHDELGPSFLDAVAAMLGCRGRVVVTGMGKSGLVGQKISATLASTGTPSLYMHAAEAIHGDLGRIVAQDLVLALSYSGESQEILKVIPALKSLGVPLVALTGSVTSTLAQHADIVLSIGRVDEACPMGLVPTASSTAMLVLGDALAMCLFSARGYGPQEYARFHPGGALGRKLMRVGEVMRKGPNNPVASAQATIRDVLRVMTTCPGRPGACSLTDAAGRLVGFFTDGDLRRHIDKPEFSLSATVDAFMGNAPRSVRAEQLVEEAARLLRTYEIDQVPVVDEERRPVGLFDIQDLLRVTA